MRLWGGRIKIRSKVVAKMWAWNFDNNITKCKNYQQYSVSFQTFAYIYLFYFALPPEALHTLLKRFWEMNNQVELYQKKSFSRINKIKCVYNKNGFFFLLKNESGFFMNNFAMKFAWITDLKRENRRLHVKSILVRSLNSVDNLDPQVHFSYGRKVPKSQIKHKYNGLTVNAILLIETPPIPQYPK